MPAHYWEDDWFREHGENLGKAMYYIQKTVKIYSGCHIMMKEKYGTIRYEHLFVPGTALYMTKFDTLLIKIFGTKKVTFGDLNGKPEIYNTPKVSWSSTWIHRKWRDYGAYVLKIAVKRACKKFPEIKEEILDDYDFSWTEQ